MAIDFIGFTGESRISGQIPLADDRLSDMLNAIARLVVRGARVEEIDLAAVETGDLTVQIADLLAVAGTGRRGLENLRKRTIRRRVQLGIGRYMITGAIHVATSTDAAALAGDPADLLIGRDLLVPLTQASIEYERRGKPCVEEWETLIVNRARLSWIEPNGDAPADALIGEAPASASVGVVPVEAGRSRRRVLARRGAR